jgi:hypothetical protein
VNRRYAPAAACAALVFLGLAEAAPAYAEQLGFARDAPAPWWRVVAALILCILLAVAAALAIKARSGGVNLADLYRARLPGFDLRGVFKSATPRRLRMVEVLRLSHQVDLCLIQVDGDDLVIAAAPGGASLVSIKPTLPHFEERS